MYASIFLFFDLLKLKTLGELLTLRKTSILDFEYQIIRSKRSTLAIHVRHKQVVVRAPLKTPQYFIMSFIAQKEPWILNKLAEQKQKASETFSFHHNATFLFLGQKTVFKLQKNDRNSVILNNNELLIQSKYLKESDKSDEAHKIQKTKKLFEDWLKQQAARHMVPKTYSLAEKLGLGERLSMVKFRKTKSKWGHCSSLGIIQFNWLIMMAPESVVNYLIAHEVCHLAFMDHSAQYHEFLGRACGDYQSARKWLRENEHRLFFSS